MEMDKELLRRLRGYCKEGLREEPSNLQPAIYIVPPTPAQAMRNDAERLKREADAYEQRERDLAQVDELLRGEAAPITNQNTSHGDK